MNIEEYNKHLENIKRGNCWAIQRVPEEYKTYELCWEAMEKEDACLNYVPEEHKSKELCLRALCGKKSRGDFYSVPKEHLTYDFYLEVIKACGELIKRVPKKFLTHEMCLTSVSNNIHNIRDIPDELITYELCVAALNNVLNNYGMFDGDEYAYGNEDRYNGNLEAIPMKHRTLKLCKYLYSKKGIHSIPFFPGKMRSDMVEMYFRKK